jgi:hypothetical protein
MTRAYSGDATRPVEVTADTSFAIIPTALLDTPHDLLPDGAIRLYGILARYANSETGVAWPSRRTLAERIGRSVDFVDRMLEALEAIGAITVERDTARRNGTETNRYRLITPGVGEPPASGPRSRQPAAQ